MIYWLILISAIYLLPIVSLLVLKQLPEFKLLFLSSREIIKNSQLLILCPVIVLAFLFVLPQLIYNENLGNFLLHFLGGGVVTSIIFEYIKLNLKIKISIITQLALLFFLISGLGCLNEMMEFLLDTLTNKQYSYSRLDTWKDILANTLGVYIGFLALSAIKYLKSRLTTIMQ